MKIGILSRNSKLYSTRRLMEEGKNRGHEICIIDALKCHISIREQQSVVYNRKCIQECDAIIPMIGALITDYDLTVLRQFEAAGSYAINTSTAISRAIDKLKAHQLLADKAIDTPATSYANCSTDTNAMIALVGGAPLIVKMTEGTQGRGVFFAETRQAAQSLINAFRELKGNFLVQEFIAEAGGSDIRCFVIGGKVVTAMKRQAKKGDFRSNLHQGGKALTVKLTPAERAIAVKAAKIMGLDMAGVDIIRSDRGSLVLEVNTSPGLQGIEALTQKNIAAMILEHVEKQVFKHRNV